MSGIADKSALLASRGIGLHTISLGELGEVKVRALTRAEALGFQGEQDASSAEAGLLAVALVEPKLTVEEIHQWQAVSPAGELAPVVDKILELSGMTAEASKEAVKSVPRQP